MPSHGEGTSQNPVIKGGLPPMKGKPYFDKSASSFGLNGDIGVGPSKMSNSVTPNQLENIAQPSGASLYKGTHGVNVAGDRTRLNVNVVPYGQNSPDDSRNLFADLNPFQIKGIGKTSVHNKTVADKAPELQSTRNNNVSGRPPIPSMRKNRYAYNEVLRNINHDPNEYGPPLLISDSSSISEKIDLNGYKLPYNSNINNDRNTQKLAQVTGSASPSGAGELKSGEDLNVDCNKGNLENSHNDMADVVKQHGNIESGRLDPRKCMHDRFMGKNLKLRDPESHSLSGNSITKRVDQMLDDVDVSECEIPWEDLVIGERIGLGNVLNLYLFCWNILYL